MYLSSMEKGILGRKSNLTYFILHPFVVGGDVVRAVGHEEEAGGEDCCKIWMCVGFCQKIGRGRIGDVPSCSLSFMVR